MHPFVSTAQGQVSAESSELMLGTELEVYKKRRRELVRMKLIHYAVIQNEKGMLLIVYYYYSRQTHTHIMLKFASTTIIYTGAA